AAASVGDRRRGKRVDLRPWLRGLPRRPRFHRYIAGVSWTAEFPLLGPAGELVDLRRVFLSHGITLLPPMRLDEKAWRFEITVPLGAAGARTLTISQARPGHGLVSVVGESVTPEAAAAAMA